MSFQNTTAHVREVRNINLTNLRSVSDGSKTYLEGYAARYNTPATIGFGAFGFQEIIAPGAFTRALREGQDVRHLINHDPNFVLGRTKSRTTVLSEDKRGLRFRTLLPNTRAANDLRESVNRGDVNECSFGFTVPKGGDVWTKAADGADLRTLKDLDLLDVSVVTYPAYPGTNAEVSRMMFPDGVPAEIRERLRPAHERPTYSGRVTVSNIYDDVSIDRMIDATRRKANQLKGRGQ